MKTWEKYRIVHSQNNFIDLYCRQISNTVEVYITNADINSTKILSHDLLIGNLSALELDQNFNMIDWEKTDFDFEKYPCEFDMAKARERNGNTDNLDYLVYHIANAINTTFNNRNYTRYLKSNILGKWVENELTLEFYEDGTYIFKGKWKPSTSMAGIPENGKYEFSKNMIFFWGTETSGLRIQIVNLIKNKLILPGFSNKLFFIMTKI